MPITIFASAALALAVQAYPASPPPQGARVLGGIAESPGSRRVPGPIELRVEPGGGSFDRDLREARRTVDRRRKAGELTRREARQLRREIAVIGSLADRYGRDGLSASERRELQMHTQTVRHRSATQGSL